MILKKFTALAISLVVITSVAGCSKVEEKANLTELTITHVTAPLNVPSIIQKNKNIFEEEFKNNGIDLKVEQLLHLKLC